MSAVVVDASVVVKWYVPEIHSDAAHWLLQRNHQFLAPDLLFAEIGNVVWKKVRRGELSQKDGRELVRDVAKTSIESVSSQALINDAYPLAVATERTVYEALYLALALRLDTVFITADERLWNSIAKNPSLKGAVQLLQKMI